jgi:hypothetical protein
MNHNAVQEPHRPRARGISRSVMAVLHDAHSTAVDLNGVFPCASADTASIALRAHWPLWHSTNPSRGCGLRHQVAIEAM